MDVDCLAATIAAFPALSPGDLVADRYRVDAVIGRGAMGVVYRVEHVHMRKRFALKVLDGAWAKTAGALARFEQEAIAAGKIADPHVVSATDFGRLPDGSCFLVLEYIDGQTLRTALKRGAFEPRRALKIARGIVSAMEAAHAAGIVHRDLKPENVMLLRREDDPDYVKVLDFGIATFASGGISPIVREADAERSAAGNAVVHGARASHWRGPGRAHRSVFRWDHSLRAAHRRSSVPWHTRLGAAAARSPRGSAFAALGPGRSRRTGCRDPPASARQAFECPFRQRA